jgi:hypothetical protein
VLSAALLAAWAGRPPAGPPTSAGPLDEWDIPRLLDYLNGQGLGLRLVSTRQDGVIGPGAFLTVTGRGWADCNRLAKDPRRLGAWRGTLYCERGPGGEAQADLARQWGEGGLAAGPFLFFGDPQLLARVRAALGPLTPPEP